MEHARAAGGYVLETLRTEGKSRLAVRDVLVVYVTALIGVAEPSVGFDPMVVAPLIDNLRSALLGQPLGTRHEAHARIRRSPVAKSRSSCTASFVCKQEIWGGSFLAQQSC